MVMDTAAPRAWCELPSVGTACGPAAAFARARLAGWQIVEVTDGGLIATAPGADATRVRLLFVVHVDEIGGMIGQPLGRDSYAIRSWGAPPRVFAGPLQAIRYDAEAPEGIPCEGTAMLGGFSVRGAGLEPWMTYFTFREPAVVEGDDLLAKAIDPRATAWAAMEAARELGLPEVGLVCCYAEECSAIAAQKVAHRASRQFPNLEYVVNADVPSPENITGVAVGEVALRHLEGRGHIDPVFTLRTYERLRARGVEVKLAVAQSSSQTAFFVPYASCLSVALPADGIHTRRARIPLAAIGRCRSLLVETARLLMER